VFNLCANGGFVALQYLSLSDLERTAAWIRTWEKGREEQRIKETVKEKRESKKKRVRNKRR
jgi:hypothetical protein